MTLFKMHKGKQICEIIHNVDGMYLFADDQDCHAFTTEEGAVEYARHLGYRFK